MLIHGIETGRVAVRTRQLKGVGSGKQRLLKTLVDREWTEPLPIYAWAIEHPEGVIVVDTGETARVSERGYFPRWHPYFQMGVREWVKPDEEIGPRLEALGLPPDEVRWVVLTHLHTDHAGGLHHFPDSEILVSAVEYEAACGLLGRARGYLNNRWPEWFRPHLVDFRREEPIGPFPASVALSAAGDVRLIPTPGHSHGHLSVLVEDGNVSVMLAGDASYTQELVLEQAVDGVAPDAVQARQTMQRILAYAAERPTVYLPSHDPDSQRRLEAREIVVPAR